MSTEFTTDFSEEINYSLGMTFAEFNEQPTDEQTERRQLAKAIVRLLRENRDLKNKLYVDEKTEINNDRYFWDTLPRLVELAHDNGEPLALMVADIDGLKRTNDQYGHLEGDRLLTTVAEAFKSVARPSDVVGRLGGDEFYVIMPGFSPLSEQSEGQLIENVAARHRKAFEKHIGGLGLPDINVGVSFGLAILQSEENASDFFRRVDKLCLSNKEARYKELKDKGVTFEDGRLQ